MTDLENKIYQAIASSNGIKGSEIAIQLSIEKKVVNSTLFTSPALKKLVRQDAKTYKWHLLDEGTHITEENAINARKPDEFVQYLQLLLELSEFRVKQFRFSVPHKQL